MLFNDQTALRCRPEAPDAWLVFRHEVGKEALLTSLQLLVCDQRDLVFDALLDALLDRQPVKSLEYRCYMIVRAGQFWTRCGFLLLDALVP